MFENIQQYFYPKEFRIDPPTWSKKMRKDLERAAMSKNLKKSRHRKRSKDPERPDIDLKLREKEEELREKEQEIAKMLAEVATGVWRIQKRLKSLEKSEDISNIEKALNPVKSTIDALKRGGIEIIEHTGEVYDPGMALKVTFQISVDVDDEIITETLKPSIRYNQELLKMGDVIVSLPENIKSNDSEENLEDISEGDDEDTINDNSDEVLEDISVIDNEKLVDDISEKNMEDLSERNKRDLNE